MAVIAGIDIGTNTLRLLIAEIGDSHFKEIYSERKITRLGEGLSSLGSLTENAIDRSLSTLKDFTTIIGKYSHDKVVVVATSAVREAGNQKYFIDLIREKTGLDIELISGEEEARRTFLGILHGLNKGIYPAGKASVEGEAPRAWSLEGATKSPYKWMSIQRAMRALRGRLHPALPVEGATQAPIIDSIVAIDIGGGSTEFICGREGRITLKMSIGLGVVKLTERHIKSDPVSEADLAAMQVEIEAKIKGIAGQIRDIKGSRLVGTAGSITTLAAIDQKMEAYNPIRINNYILKLASLEDIFFDLISRSIMERRKIVGLEPGREDIIVAGTAILKTVMQEMGYKSLIVSDYGLREGIVIDAYMKRQANPEKIV